MSRDPLPHLSRDQTYVTGDTQGNIFAPEPPATDESSQERLPGGGDA